MRGNAFVVGASSSLVVKERARSSHYLNPLKLMWWSTSGQDALLLAGRMPTLQDVKKNIF